MLAQGAAVQNVADHVFAANGAHAQLDESIAQQNAGAHTHFAGKILERSRNADGCSGDIARSNHESRTARNQHWFVVPQAPGADFWPLQILQDANGSIFFFGSAAQAFDIASMVFMGAMRKIQASDVHAQSHQIAHGRFGVAGGTNGADNLCTASGGDGSGTDRKNTFLYERIFLRDFWLALFHKFEIRICSTGRDYCNGLTALLFGWPQGSGAMTIFSGC